MSRVTSSWAPPLIAPGAEAFEVAGGIELSTKGGATSATCGACGDWDAGEPAAMRVWKREHAAKVHDARRPAVLGLDLSLTSAGIGLIVNHPGVPLVGAWPEVSVHVGAAGKKTDTYLDRNVRLVKQVRAIMRVVDQCRNAGAAIELAVVEGPIYGMKVLPSYFDRAALWWSIYAALTARGIAVAVVTPAHREAFITGMTGHSMKPAERKQRVLEEMRLLWSCPNGTQITRDPDRCIVNDDEADALGLATMGVMARQWSVAFRPRRRHVENVHLVSWPEVL